MGLVVSLQFQLALELILQRGEPLINFPISVVDPQLGEDLLVPPHGNPTPKRSGASDTSVLALFPRADRVVQEFL